MPRAISCVAIRPLKKETMKMATKKTTKSKKLQQKSMGKVKPLFHFKTGDK